MQLINSKDHAAETMQCSQVKQAHLTPACQLVNSQSHTSQCNVTLNVMHLLSGVRHMYLNGVGTIRGASGIQTQLTSEGGRACDSTMSFGRVCSMALVTVQAHLACQTHVCLRSVLFFLRHFVLIVSRFRTNDAVAPAMLLHSRCCLITLVQFCSVRLH